MYQHNKKHKDSLIVNTDLFNQIADFSSIGILGGSFDPIHNGHLLIAECVMQELKLEAILFTPANCPPHKLQSYAPSVHRAEMIKLAIADNDNFYLNTMELDDHSLKYTVDSIAKMRDFLPDVKINLILGADMALDFRHWRMPELIMEMADIVAVNRPGLAIEQLRYMIDWPPVSRIKIINVPGVDISSTDIRERVANGKSIRYLTPYPVVKYIKTHNLYR
jgi:nicotinate-nucleotide adenylyltransferase